MDRRKPTIAFHVSREFSKASLGQAIVPRLIPCCEESSVSLLASGERCQQAAERRCHVRYKTRELLLLLPPPPQSHYVRIVLQVLLQLDALQRSSLDSQSAAYQRRNELPSVAIDAPGSH